MLEGKRETGWLQRNASVIALCLTIVTIAFGAGVAWAITKEREYINERDAVIQQALSSKIDEVLYQIGRLQGWKEAQAEKINNSQHTKQGEKQ